MQCPCCGKHAHAWSQEQGGACKFNNLTFLALWSHMHAIGCRLMSLRIPVHADDIWTSGLFLQTARAHRWRVTPRKRELVPRGPRLCPPRASSPESLCGL